MFFVPEALSAKLWPSVRPYVKGFCVWVKAVRWLHLRLIQSGSVMLDSEWESCSFKICFFVLFCSFSSFLPTCPFWSNLFSLVKQSALTVAHCASWPTTWRTLFEANKLKCERLCYYFIFILLQQKKSSMMCHLALFGQIILDYIQGILCWLSFFQMSEISEFVVILIGYFEHCIVFGVRKS